MPLSERIRKSGTNGDVTITNEERNNEGKPETEVSPVPTVIVSLPSTDKPRQKPNLTPPSRSDEIDVHAQAARKHGIVEQANPRMSVTSETIVEVSHHGGDPRLGFSTPYYWREKPDMRKYYQLQTEFPTLSGADKFGPNFTTESEQERDHQLYVMGPHPLMRTRFTQTSSVGVHDAAVQFRTPAIYVETQSGIATNEVATQIDYLAGFDNFGLPPNLEVATIVEATRHRGVTERWVTQGIELKYCADRHQRFTSVEKSNVDAVVRVITTARRDESRAIFGSFLKLCETNRLEIRTIP